MRLNICRLVSAPFWPTVLEWRRKEPNIFGLPSCQAWPFSGLFCSPAWRNLSFCCFSPLRPNCRHSFGSSTANRLLQSITAVARFVRGMWTAKRWYMLKMNNSLDVQKESLIRHTISLAASVILSLIGQNSSWRKNVSCAEQRREHESDSLNGTKMGVWVGRSLHVKNYRLWARWCETPI